MFNIANGEFIRRRQLNHFRRKGTILMSDTLIDPRCTRRDFFSGLAALAPTLGVVGVSLASVGGSATAAEDTSADGVTHTADAIHQEIVFQAAPERVYAALIDPRQFDKVIDLSGIRKSGMLPPEANKPTQIRSEAGAAFILFGGFITGRQIELVPNVRIVQAWRVAAWGPGVFSIAKFELQKQGAATRLVFDHTGFPKGAGKSLAAGWHKHYWQPLTKFLAQASQ
jgi:activator of HSP90 ATPase